MFPYRRLVVIGAMLYAATMARAELRLLADVGGRDLPVVAIDEHHQVFAADGERRVALAANTRYRVDGAIRDEARWVVFSPSYGIFEHVGAASGGESTVGARWSASVSLRHFSGSAGRKWSSELLQRWPAGVPDRALLVLGWLVHGDLVETEVKAIPSTSGLTFSDLTQLFSLKAGEEKGQGILLLWREGILSRPRPTSAIPRRSARFSL